MAVLADTGWGGASDNRKCGILTIFKSTAVPCA